VLEFQHPAECGTNEKRLAYYERCMSKLLAQANVVRAAMLDKGATKADIDVWNRKHRATRRALVEKMAKYQSAIKTKTDEEKAEWRAAARTAKTYDADIDVTEVTEVKPDGDALEATRGL
jgi:predicted kinase